MFSSHKEWANFTEGLRESVVKGVNWLNYKQPIMESTGEAEGNQVATIMQPEEICELWKKLTVVNEENEGMVSRRIREIESLAEEEQRS